MTMTEIQQLLTTLMRGIDKKTLLTVEERPDPERPGVTVHLTRDKRTGSLQFTEEDLIAGQAHLMGRNRLRTALKHARDRMWEASTDIFSTKLAHPKPEASQWSRPSQGGRGRR